MLEFALAILCGAIVHSYTGNRLRAFLTYAILVIYPTVVANGRLKLPNSYSVLVDDHLGVGLAVDHLVQKGLVGREPDQADRRKVHLSLRPSARALVRKGQSARDTLLQELVSGFTPEEIDQMEHLEQKLLEQIRLVLKKL